MEYFPAHFCASSMKRISDPVVKIDELHKTLSEFRKKIYDIVVQAREERQQFAYFLIDLEGHVMRVANKDELLDSYQQSYDRAFKDPLNFRYVTINRDAVLHRLEEELSASWGFYFTSLHETAWDTDVYKFYRVDGSPERPKNLKPDADHGIVEKTRLCSGRCRIEFPE